MKARALNPLLLCLWRRLLRLLRVHVLRPAVHANAQCTLALLSTPCYCCCGRAQSLVHALLTRRQSPLSVLHSAATCTERQAGRPQQPPPTTHRRTKPPQLHRLTQRARPALQAVTLPSSPPAPAASSPPPSAPPCSCPARRPPPPGAAAPPAHPPPPTPPCRCPGGRQCRGWR